jgi:hypothetical protein
MIDAEHGYVVQLMTVIVIQQKVDEILDCASADSGNGQDA